MQIFPFTPSPRAASSFMPTLDGQQYSCVVSWNLQAQRYYLNLFTLAGQRVLTVAIVESPAAKAVQSIAYDGNQGAAVLTTVAPHGIGIGRTVRRTVDGCLPDDYAGTFLMLATSPTTLTYPLPSMPLGPATSAGTVSALASLVQGYFSSTLVLRGGQFEVSP